MTREEMIQKMGEWIGEIMELPPPNLTDGTDLIRDLLLDSLALAELGAKLRMSYHVRIRASEFANRLQVGAIIDLVQEKLREKDG